MSLPAGTIHIGGIACTPDGAVYVEPTGSASITGTASTGFPVRLDSSAVAVTAANDTNENTLATITVAAGTLGSNGEITVEGFLSLSGTGNKTIRVRFGGGAGTDYLGTVQTTSAGVYFRVVIANSAATNSQVGHGYMVNGSGAATTSRITSSVDTTAATSIVISGQKATGTDLIRLDRYSSVYMKASNA
jgi:hypothetical protein